MQADLQTRCVRIRLKSGSLEAVREWQRFIAEHKEAALDTLIAEGVFLEAVFLDIIGEDHYLIYIMRAENFEGAQRVTAASVNFVDEYHQKFKAECWEKGERLEMLIDLQRPVD